MGGDLLVESEVGEGSRFYFTLPLVPAGSEALERDANEGATLLNARLAPGQELMALVVDDSTVNRRILAKLLQSAGVQVISAAGGAEAIELALEHRPGVIFMDLKMPDVDGLEATRRLRADARTSHVPIIAVTASAFGDTRRAAREAGCADYLPKPVRAEALYAMLQDRLHVRFVRDDDTGPVFAIDWPDEPRRTAIAARMREALAIGAVTDIETLARELSDGDPREQALGRRLARLAGEFDFDGLSHLARAMGSAAADNRGDV
jgi:CheY-like chemotaxis protein